MLTNHLGTQWPSQIDVRLTITSRFYFSKVTLLFLNSQSHSHRLNSGLYDLPLVFKDVNQPPPHPSVPTSLDMLWTHLFSELFLTYHSCSVT